MQASVGSEEDQTTYRSCYALLLFGVPNRGLNNLSLKSMVKGQPNESLVRDLGESSRFLSLLHERFNACFAFDDSHILSISETRHTATLEVSVKIYVMCLKTILTCRFSGILKLAHGKGPDLKS